MQTKTTFFKGHIHTVSKQNQDNISPQFPLIIWGDKHNSPLNYTTLLSLLPYFAECGYAKFGLEYDCECTLETLINKIKESIQNAYEYKKIIESNKLKSYEPHIQTIIQKGVEMIPALEKRLLLFENIKKQGWSYQGLDMNFGKERGNLKNREKFQEPELYNQRNNTIAKNVIKLDQNIRGEAIHLIGLRHVIGVSELLSQSIGKEITKKIVFLYVFTPGDPDVNEIIKQKAMLVEKYGEQGISFNLIADDAHCLNNIKKIIEANTKTTVAIKKIEASDESKEATIKKQKILTETEEMEGLNNSLRTLKL